MKFAVGSKKRESGSDFEICIGFLEFESNSIHTYLNYLNLGVLYFPI